MLSEKKSDKTKKVAFCVIPFTGTVQNRQVHRDRKQVGDCQRLGGAEEHLPGVMDTVSFGRIYLLWE